MVTKLPLKAEQLSDFADLDRVACAALTRRGRYQPARDAKGDPVVSSATRPVVWRLPAG